MTERVPAWPDLDRDSAELCAALCDPERLRALERSGLGAAPDPDMDHFASWVRRALDVPAAAVSLVREDVQVIPGASGLDEPLASERSIPLTHSLCQWVIAAATPLVISDTRGDPRMRDNPAVSEFGMLAYAGIPLFDRDGNVLGSLCAVDRKPRRWAPDDVDTLTSIARACSTELRLRLLQQEALNEEQRRDQVEAGQQRAFDRSQTLLEASQAFTDTVTVADARAQITELLTAALAPAHIDMAILDRRELPETGRGAWDPGSMASTAVRERRILHYPDRAAFDRAHPGEAGAELRARGLHCIVVAPLPITERIVGAVLLGWSRPKAVEPTDLLTIATLAGYAGQALGRAGQLSHRTSVAFEMQEAMLTTLPTVPDVAMAARYLPADSREAVGGDWYDAATLTDPDRPDDGVLMLSVGDIIGHSLPAVTIMGQVRSMLRQAAADHPGGPPSKILDAFENANTQFDIGATGTAILALLRRDPDGIWSITWTNAGHPAPILLDPDGTSHLLDPHDSLFGFGLTGPGERTDHQRRIKPGSVLFLYTDGLVERPGSDLDSGTDNLLELLDTVRDREPQEIVDSAVQTLTEDTHHDDVVAFAIRIPAGRP